MKIPLFNPETREKLSFSEKENIYFDKSKKYRSFENIPDLFIKDENPLTSRQSEFYNEVKFPNYDDLDNFGTLLDKSYKSIFAKKLDEEIPMGANVLEAGCGTGQLSIALSRYNRKIFGIDLSEGSLIEGQKFIIQNNIKSVFLSKMNIFKLFFDKGFFDVVISNGVLHHTHNPELSFKKLVEVLKPEGIIVIGLYHRYGRTVQKIRQKSIKLFGDNFKFLDKRFKEKISEKRKKAWFLDQYKNPSETTHTLQEIVGWFNKYNIDYISSIPFGFNLNNKLFENQKLPSSFELFLKEVSLMFNLRQIYEGGFFVTIGRKKLK